MLSLTARQPPAPENRSVDGKSPRPETLKTAVKERFVELFEKRRVILGLPPLDRDIVLIFSSAGQNISLHVELWMPYQPKNTLRHYHYAREMSWDAETEHHLVAGIVAMVDEALAFYLALQKKKKDRNAPCVIQ